MVLNTATHGADQMMVQRYLSARSQRQAATALVASGFVILAQFAFFLLIGVSLWVFYRVFPPRRASDRPALASSDEVFTYFIVHYLPTGVLGLVIAAIFSAAMGTLAGSLNSSASTIVNDLYRPFTGRNDERHLMRVSRVMTVLWGVVLTAVAFGARRLEDNVVNNALAIAVVRLGHPARAVPAGDLDPPRRAVGGAGGGARRDLRRDLRQVRDPAGLALVRPGRLVHGVRRRPGGQLRRAGSNRITRGARDRQDDDSCQLVELGTIRNHDTRRPPPDRIAQPSLRVHRHPEPSGDRPADELRGCQGGGGGRGRGRVDRAGDRVGGGPASPRRAADLRRGGDVGAPRCPRCRRVPAHLQHAARKWWSG